MKTIRYYSDIGLRPESGRSRGGHRRYAADALPRLRLIQRLRALDTPIDSIATVMTGQHSLADLVTRELDTVQAHMRELTWRQGILRTLDDCPELERLRRLALLAEVGKLDEAHDRLVRYWHWALPTSLPHRLTRAVIEGAVPVPPATPTGTTVLAYAELHALTSGDDRRRQPQSHQVGDVASFYSGIMGACTLAAEALVSGCPTRRAEALGHFVRTYARISGHDDTPAFRAHLRTRFRHTAHHGSFPLRYWRHALAVTSETPPQSTATGQGHLAASLATLHEHVAGLPLAPEHWADSADTTVRLAEEARGTWRHYTPADHSE
ncbi:MULTISPECIES: MerR family transcriptional regulator [unclassified Streptomyces]|uniref:helix-turn-helix domain-containing protein n=1 Tax=unclassified Streptomyces TaxID=2593676 RepID=UPI00225C430A|nr:MULTISPECIES: MerR family transcriptional regulator [unclassified Streptomyces]MCX4869408.1 MerR family transcriptional regulator [Streptomyces sp. NBC_00906]MCX4900647.1 MerR family transcriptional regulator [Streptomyces sp. NBC_00892]